jgi:hypothetical protein
VAQLHHALRATRTALHRERQGLCRMPLATSFDVV